MTALSEWQSKELLGPRLARPREALTTTIGEALAFAASLGAPVVAKASGVAHKTETGGVRVGLDATALADCWRGLAEAGDGTVLVAEQVRGDFELAAGGLRDPQFGPLVSIGLGGILTEVLRDIAFMLAPPEPGELDAAIGRLRSAPLFAGYRNRPVLSRERLGDILSAISDLLIADPGVAEVDCNPIIVRDGVPIVADALVVRS
jgi:acetate---CoA ligase (ADP-forming) subunit beta